VDARAPQRHALAEQAASTAAEVAVQAEAKPLTLALAEQAATESSWCSATKLMARWGRARTVLPAAPSPGHVHLAVSMCHT